MPTYRHSSGAVYICGQKSTNGPVQCSVLYVARCLMKLSPMPMSTFIPIAALLNRAGLVQLPSWGNLPNMDSLLSSCARMLSWSHRPTAVDVHCTLHSWITCCVVESRNVLFGIHITGPKIFERGDEIVTTRWHGAWAKTLETSIRW